MNSSSPTRGLVLGKFLPPHNGHVYLIDFARNYVDSLTVAVDALSNQPIPGELRVHWLTRMFPDVRIVHLRGERPQYPHEHQDFWTIWRNSLTEAIDGDPLDYLFASEEYGVRLSQELSATFVPVDITRNAIPISGTEIRERPLKHWEHIPREVRPYFTKRVCVFGPESTGKSTLTRDLARHFQTVAVPEYARTHIEHNSGKLELNDIPMIARGQQSAEDALAYNSNRVMFCDTDLLTTTIWSDWMFQSCPEWVAKEAEKRTYDLYLLTDVDVPWINDQVRYLPDERRSFFVRCKQELENRNRPYKIVRGTWKERFDSAVAAVTELLTAHQ